MTSITPRIGIDLPHRPVPFLGTDYYKSLAERGESGRFSDKLLTTHIGSTVVGRLVEKNAPVELATRINALTPLKLAHAVRGWRATKARIQKEKEYKAIWQNFETDFLDYAETRKNVNVLQIGAYDGVTHDRMHPLLSQHPGWQAVLVEPMPQAFEQLKHSYANRPNTRFVNAAVGDVEGEIDMHYIGSTKNAPLFIDLTATTRPSTLEMFQEAGAAVETTKVRSTILPNLLKDMDLPASQLDMLFIDAEGCDYTILKQLMASETALPAFIVAEHDHMSDSEYHETAAKLFDRGYSISPIAHDILAKRV
jgi:FkbM family methyltransferase